MEKTKQDFNEKNEDLEKIIRFLEKKGKKLKVPELDTEFIKKIKNNKTMIDLINDIINMKIDDNTKLALVYSMLSVNPKIALQIHSLTLGEENLKRVKELVSIITLEYPAMLITSIIKIATELLSNEEFDRYKDIIKREIKYINIDKKETKKELRDAIRRSKQKDQKNNNSK